MFDLDIFFDENTEIRNLFEDLESSFKFSLGINPSLENEINKVYSRTLNNYGRFILGGFQLRLFERAEQLARLSCDEDSIDLINRFFPKAYSILKKKGFKDDYIAAFLGNVQQECDFNPSCDDNGVLAGGGSFIEIHYS